ncbi:MAG: hypothetical protein AAB401_23110 [Acidobacteriota bacterium]
MSQITLEYVEQLSSQLPIEDQRVLSEHLKVKLSNGSTVPESEQKPQDLFGLWKGAFPLDLDVDAALYEIRHEWEKELEELGL